MADRKPRSWPAISGSEQDRGTIALRRLEDLTRLISDWVWETDADGVLAYVSERVIERLGKHPVLLVGRRLDDVGRFVSDRGETIAGPSQTVPFRDVRFEVEGSDGTFNTFAMSGLPRFDESSEKFIGATGIAKDVTALLSAERANTRLADAIDVLYGFFALYDERDRLVISNARFREYNRMFAEHAQPGGRFEDLLRREVTAGRYPDAEGRAEQWIENRLRQRTAPRGPFEVALADGRFLLVDEQRMPDGGSVTMANDITEMKRAMTVLQDSARQHREFAANVAHRLRTPLAVLRTSIDTMGNSEIRDSLKRDVDGLARMVEQLLTLTRYESMVVPRDAVADLTHIVIEVVATLAPGAIKEGRAVDLDAPEDSIPVRGDAGAIEHAVRNLVENAIKYSARRSTVHVRVEPSPPTVRVVNAGRSIPIEAKARLLEKFARIDRRGAGAGLGLNIVKSVADSHGADIMVSDAEGGGTDVTITFPTLVESVSRRPRN